MASDGEIPFRIPCSAVEADAGGGSSESKVGDSVGSGGYSVVRTHPDELLRHDISDEELEALCNMKRGPLYEGKWTAIGLFIGGLPQTIQAIYSAYIIDEKVAISMWDLTAIVVVGISAALFGVLHFVVSDTQEVADKLLEKIKNRPKIVVTNKELTYVSR